MPELKGVSKSYEQSLTPVAGIGECVTPLRARYAAAIESSGVAMIFYEWASANLNSVAIRSPSRTKMAGCFALAPI